MNTDENYVRDADRRQPEPASTEPSDLAKHGDPSKSGATKRSPISEHGIAWVRPSDVPTLIGSRVIGRGLDLKAELVRRANRPTRSKSPMARVTKTAIAETEPPSITHKRPGGLSL